MTTREFYSAIASTETISVELRETAVELLAKMDSKQANARKHDSEKWAKENASLIASIHGTLDDSPKLTAEIASAVGISTPKASAILRKMVESGAVVAVDVKVPKSGVRKAYKLA